MFGKRQKLSFLELLEIDPRAQAWTTSEEDYILTWGQVLKPV
jgi:hypothetical protein